MSVPTPIPAGIVKARRVAAGILLTSSVLTVAAIAFGIVWWLNRPPVVVPISCPVSTCSTTGLPPSVASTASVATPADVLVAHRAADGAVLASVPDGYWVPQLASNRPGPDRTGHTWTEQAILTDHERLRSAYGAALVWSGDYASFRDSDYWVTVAVTAAYPTAADAIAWCRAQQLDDDHCFARRLSQDPGYSGDNAVHQ